jgi:hypothetical protein
LLEDGGVSSSEAQRTLVKSPPELWAELSDPVSLARHLGELGEIRVTRTEPEEIVEWEAQDVKGTVQIKPSGWGTRVALTLVREAREPELEPQAQVVRELELEPQVAQEPEPAAQLHDSATAQAASEQEIGFFARLFRRRRKVQAVEPEPEPSRAAEPEPPPVEEPEPPPVTEPPNLAAELARVEETLAEQDAALLTGVLDRLGAAHHRPFSRA